MSKPSEALESQGAIITQNPRRNLAMRVYQNADGKGTRSSITRHEPLQAGRFIVARNHGYLKYQQPNNAV